MNTGRHSADVCSGNVEVNFEAPYYQVIYTASESCAVGCDLKSGEVGASCP